MRFHNIDFINKGWVATILSGFMLDWLVDAKFKRQKIWRMFSRMITFMFSSTKLKQLTEGEVRVIDEQIVLNRGNLFAYLKIDLPIVEGYGLSTQDVVMANQMEFFRNIREFKKLEFFYVRRQATIQDYLPYIYYINHNFKKEYTLYDQKIDKDRQLMALEKDVQEFIDRTNLGVTECYLMVSTPCLSVSRVEVDQKRELLEQEVVNIVSAFKNSSIQTRLVEGDQLHQFLVNNLASRSGSLAS
jgi:hypothetical protein